MEKSRCRASIFKDWHNHQCKRKSWKDGYCKQHHPEEIKNRTKERMAAWDAKWENQKKQREIRDLEMVIKLTKQAGFDEVADYFAKLLVEKVNG
jgi:hypothetical protein